VHCVTCYSLLSGTSFLDFPTRNSEIDCNHTHCGIQQHPFSSFQDAQKSKTDVGKEIIHIVLKMEGTIPTYDTRPITSKLTRFVCGKD